MAFEFKKGQWYIAIAKKAIAGILEGERVFFAPYPSGIMTEHWIVSDGLGTPYVMHTNAMKEYVESDKDELGRPIEVQPDDNKILWSVVERMGFTRWKP